MHKLPQFCAVVYAPLAPSVQFCLKKHPGIVEMLSDAAGLNLTGMRLQQENPADDLQIILFVWLFTCKLWENLIIVILQIFYILPVIANDSTSGQLMQF